MIKSLIFFICIFLSSWCSTAQSVNDIINGIELLPYVAPDTINRPYDEREIEWRAYGDKLSEQYKDADFDYRIRPEAGEDAISRFLSWIGEGLSYLFGSLISREMMEVLKYVIYGLLIVLAIYVIIRFLGLESFRGIMGKSAKKSTQISLEEVDLDQINFEALIQKAIDQSDYRSALRYHFLAALHYLSSQDFIDWQYKKTNMDYQLELKDRAAKKSFKEAAMWYDYVWYGRFDIHKKEYDQAVESILKLHQIQQGNG